MSLNCVLELFARLINCVNKQHAEQNVHLIQPPVGNGVDYQNIKMEQNGDDTEYIDVFFPEAGQLTLFAATLFQFEIVDGLLLFLKKLFYFFHNVFPPVQGRKGSRPYAPLCFLCGDKPRILAFNQA